VSKAVSRDRECPRQSQETDSVQGSVSRDREYSRQFLERKVPKAVSKDKKISKAGLKRQRLFNLDLKYNLKMSH
jgi:hypothetical protein